MALHPRVPTASQSQATACNGAFACPHKGGTTCPALSQLFALHGEPENTPETAEWLAKVRPCTSCKVHFESGRASLRGLRLGQRERDVLMGAAATETFVVTTRGMTRSESAARRRAALSLTKAGLIAQAPKKVKGRATVQVTPLGLYVLAAYGRFIEPGKPVRWDRPSSKIPLPGRDPYGLLDQAMSLAQGALRETLDDLKRVLIAAVGRPIRDPSQLESVTRNLQKKAEGLRRLIETTTPTALPLANTA